MGKQNDWTEYLRDALQNAELPVEDHSWAHRTLSERQSSPGRIAAGAFSTGFGKRRASGWMIGGLAAAAAIALCVLLWRPGATTPDGLTAELAEDHIESLAADGTESIAKDLTDGLTAGLKKDLAEDHIENLSENLSKEQTDTDGVTVITDAMKEKGASFNNPYLALATSIKETSDENGPAAENAIVTENNNEVETVPTMRDSEEKTAVPDSQSENESIDDRLATGNNDIAAENNRLATGNNDILAGSDDITAWENDIDSRRADRSRRKVSIGLSGSMGSVASPDSFGFGLFAIDSDISNPQSPFWDDIYTYNIGELNIAGHYTNATDNFTHRQPVTFALTVGFPLNERLSLVSGVQFSRVQSTIRAAGKDVAQELNYIGIPLQAQYSLTDNGVFRTYAAAGVLGEKLLSGYFDDKRLNTDEAVQMSLNASLGARVQLWRNFSLRLEPGIRYYLTDSDFITYRTGHPFIFSITFGASIDL